MNCELISVGTEILLGDILNTNAQFLSRRLAALGVPLNGTNCVNSIDDFLNNCKNCKKFGNLL